jgi:hypothetical protein
MQTYSNLIVRKDDLRSTRMHSAPLPEGAELPAGAALLRVDHFALTANNVTYGAFGDALSYWRFFPVEKQGWGCIPAWGFGTVLQSNAADVAPDERFYGYFPMASHVVLQPTRMKDAGFVDGAPHRAALHPLYNQYTRVTMDALYRAEDENLLMLLRPLFIASFMIDDLLADNGFFGASAVLVSSASSKTAYGTAFQLAQRKGIEIIGLTSPVNLRFVQSLGCYDRVLPYDAATSLPADLQVAYVDMAGNGELLSTLHHHFRDAMRYSCVVGATNWEKIERADTGLALPGAKPTQFFAPAQIKKRAADWGSGGFQRNFAAGWQKFVARVKDPAAPWLRVSQAQGAEAVERIYRELLEGRTDPQLGHVLSLAA